VRGRRVLLEDHSRILAVVYTLVLWDSGTYVCASLVDVCIQKKGKKKKKKKL
jgi:hypothetical protein